MTIDSFDISEYNLNTPSDMFPIEPPNLLAPFIDLTPLSTQLDGMHLDIQTQSLRIEVERAKRQKLSVSLKRARKEVSYPATSD